MRFLSTACSILESARLTCCGPGFIVETLCVYFLRCSQSSGTMVLQLNLHTALNFMIRDGAVKVSSFSRGNLLCFCQTHQPLFIYLSVYLIIYLSSYLPVLLSIFLSIYLSIYLWIYLSIYRSIYLSIFLSIFLSIYLSFFLSISIYLSIYLSI